MHRSYANALLQELPPATGGICKKRIGREEYQLPEEEGKHNNIASHYRCSLFCSGRVGVLGCLAFKSCFFGGGGGGVFVTDRGKEGGREIEVVPVHINTRGTRFREVKINI